jgi:7-alpha-hydroxysteroid dehydrogenase
LAALDLCPRIRVNAIAPGSILTSALDITTTLDLPLITGKGLYAGL